MMNSPGATHVSVATAQDLSSTSATSIFPSGYRLLHVHTSTCNHSHSHITPYASQRSLVLQVWNRLVIYPWYDSFHTRDRPYLSPGNECNNPTFHPTEHKMLTNARFLSVIITVVVAAFAIPIAAGCVIIICNCCAGLGTLRRGRTARGRILSIFSSIGCLRLVI